MPRAQPTQMELPMPNDNNELVVSTLRPGYLVGCATSVTGNVKYDKETIEEEHAVRGGALKATWQTTRTITEPEEFKKASQARLKARQTISGVCARSAFGLLCPENQSDQLALAIKEAERIVATFNRTARLTRVEIHVVTGQILQDDVRAVRAIKSETRELLREMTEGVKNLDVKRIRDAAGRARNLGSMLAPTASEQLKAAIEAGRGAARKIIKAGEDSAQEIDRAAITAINQARTSFLDIEEDEIPTEARRADTRAVDVDPETVPVVRHKAKKAKTAKKTIVTKAALRRRAEARETA